MRSSLVITKGLGVARDNGAKTLRAQGAVRRQAQLPEGRWAGAARCRPGAGPNPNRLLTTHHHSLSSTTHSGETRASVVMAVMIVGYDFANLKQVQAQKNEGQKRREREQQVHDCLGEPTCPRSGTHAPTVERRCQDGRCGHFASGGRSVVTVEACVALVAGADRALVLASARRGVLHLPPRATDSESASLGEITMYIVHVFVHVKVDHLDAFKRASAANGEASRQEPGVVRFDVLQSQSDPTRFVLIEVYRDEHAPLLHKETAHYATWRDTVAPMMEAPRISEKYTNVSPTDAEWR